jgi:hypothetical protein
MTDSMGASRSAEIGFPFPRETLPNRERLYTMSGCDPAEARHAEA